MNRNDGPIFCWILFKCLKNTKLGSVPHKNLDLVPLWKKTFQNVDLNGGIKRLYLLYKEHREGKTEIKKDMDRNMIDSIYAHFTYEINTL